METWKDISGYEFLYAVSDTGAVLNLQENELMAFGPTQDYYKVTFKKGKSWRRYYVHRLVYSTFKGAIPRGCNINHKNRNKLDNHIDNLECVSFQENSTHAFLDKPKFRRYTGVYFNKKTQKWFSVASHGGFHYYMGQFNTEPEAASAYYFWFTSHDIQNKYAVLIDPDDVVIITTPIKKRRNDSESKALGKNIRMISKQLQDF